MERSKSNLVRFCARAVSIGESDRTQRVYIRYARELYELLRVKRGEQGEPSRIANRHALIGNINKARAVDDVVRLIWNKVVW